MEKKKILNILIIAGAFLGSILLGFIVFRFVFHGSSNGNEGKVIPQQTHVQNEKQPQKNVLPSEKEQVASQQKYPREGKISHKAKVEPAEVKVLKPLSKEGPFLFLVVTGLGLSTELTELAITELPPEIGLSFSPYAKMINRWITPTKDAGHPIFLELPTEMDIESAGILTYFDGILLTYVKLSSASSERLADIAFKMVDTQKIVLDQRLLAENKFAKEMKMQGGKFYFVDATITGDILMRENQDPLQKQGIVTITAELIPYLIQRLKTEKPTYPFAKLENIEGR